MITIPEFTGQTIKLDFQKFIVNSYILIINETKKQLFLLHLLPKILSKMEITAKYIDPYIKFSTKELNAPFTLALGMNVRYER